MEDQDDNDVQISKFTQQNIVDQEDSTRSVKFVAHVRLYPRKFDIVVDVVHGLYLRS